MKSRNKEFCDFCGHFNEDDGDTCLYCGADMRPDAERRKEPEKRSGMSGIGSVLLAVIIVAVIVLAIAKQV